jgi:translation elongation factor P/translation initiation factor 5A
MAADEIHKGLNLMVDDQPYVVIDFRQVESDTGRPTIKAKLQNTVTRDIREHTCHKDENGKWKFA